jgi:hypothetical protein
MTIHTQVPGTRRVSDLTGLGMVTNFYLIQTEVSMKLLFFPVLDLLAGYPNLVQIKF